VNEKLKTSPIFTDAESELVTVDCQVSVISAACDAVARNVITRAVRSLMGFILLNLQNTGKILTVTSSKN